MFLPACFTKEILFVFLFELHGGSLSANEERKKWALWDVFDLFATHAGLVHDVTDTDCWAKNGSTHRLVYHNRQTPVVVFNKQDEKWSEQLLCVHI